MKNGNKLIIIRRRKRCSCLLSCYQHLRDVDGKSSDCDVNFDETPGRNAEGLRFSTWRRNPLMSAKGCGGPEDAL